MESDLALYRFKVYTILFFEKSSSAIPRVLISSLDSFIDCIVRNPLSYAVCHGRNRVLCNGFPPDPHVIHRPKFIGYSIEGNNKTKTGQCFSPFSQMCTKRYRQVVYLRASGPKNVRFLKVQRRPPAIFFNVSLPPKNPPAETVSMASIVMILQSRIVEDFQSFLRRTQHFERHFGNLYHAKKSV
jgi:hypothetical protein